MKSLRKVIRKLILESDGIHLYKVHQASEDDGNKRYIGHYAKKIFAQNADIEFLKSLTYIHTKRFDKVDSFLQMNPRDEISCIVVDSRFGGNLEIPYSFGDIAGAHRISFVIEGYPTWVQNKNAASGHSGRLLDKYHGGVRPPSGVNKAPSKMYGRKLPAHQLDGVIMDEEDLDNFGLMDFEDRANKNNEATLDNWRCVGIIRLIGHTDHKDTLTNEYNQKIDQAIEKIKTRWPQARVIEAIID